MNLSIPDIPEWNVGLSTHKQSRYYSASFFTGTVMRVLLAPMEGVLDSLVRELLTEVNDYDLCVTDFCAWSICCCR